MCRPAQRTVVVVCVCIASFLVAMDASAQRPIVEGAVSAGSGASFGTGDGETVVLQSPTYVDIDIIFSNDELPTFEYVLGFQAELQGRVSAGLIPQIRVNSGPSDWLAYGLVGIPFVFAPFVLVGVEAGAGLLWRALPRVGFFVEVVVDLFFIGNDLPDDGMLVQLDGNLGVRAVF